MWIRRKVFPSFDKMSALIHDPMADKEATASITVLSHSHH